MILVLLCALASTPLDRAVAHLKAERFDQALAELEQADPSDARYAETRDGAVKGFARELQRADGYAAALRFLERHLESRALVDHYVEVCIWGGEEQRGLDQVGRLSGAMQPFSRFAELQLHWVLLDFDSMARIARDEGWSDWAEYAEKQGALRRRFAERAARGWWVALWAALAMGGVCLVLRKLAPQTRIDRAGGSRLEATG